MLEVICSCNAASATIAAEMLTGSTAAGVAEDVEGASG